MYKEEKILSYPLENIRVLDLTRLLPGPFCTMILADFGAEVIKIEDPKKGDYLRYFEPLSEGMSAYFHTLNRNKKSVTLDLKIKEDYLQFLSLVQSADVLVESFRPDVMKRLNLDYETLKTVNPRLIYCSITGYGQTGPYKNNAGHDLNFLSQSGALSMMGKKGEKPDIHAIQIADLAGGAYPAIVGILLALLNREKTKKGEFIDISMLDGVLSLLPLNLPKFLVGEKVEQEEELLNGGYACYQIYETKDGRYLSVCAMEPKFWEKFCKIISRPELIPLLYAPIERQKTLIQEIQSILYKKTIEEWKKIFQEEDCCVTPLVNLEELIKDPHIQCREIFQSINGITTIANPIKLQHSKPLIKSKAPKLGEHNEKILKRNEKNGRTT